MNDDRIEPTLGSIDTDDEKTPSLDTSMDKKEHELSLDDDIFKVPSDDDKQEYIKIDTKIDTKIDDNIEDIQNDTIDSAKIEDSAKIDTRNESEDFSVKEELSIKMVADRGRHSIDEELAKPDIFDSSLQNDKPAYKDYNAAPFSLFTGRIDRFHATVILVGASLLSLLLLAYSDAILYFVLSNTTGAVEEYKYQADPLIYIGISVSFLLISLLIIAMGRLRDIGWSPLFSIFLFGFPLIIPALIIIFMTTLPGTPKSNKYGAVGGSYGLKTWLLAGLFLGLLPLLIYMNSMNIGDHLGEIVKRFNSE